MKRLLHLRRKALVRRISACPPACAELTFRLHVPIMFQKTKAFCPQSRVRLLTTFGFGTGDRIVRNDEVVGSIPTSSTIPQQLTGRISRLSFTIFATMKSSVSIRVAAPFLNDLGAQILRLCSTTFQ